MKQVVLRIRPVEVMEDIDLALIQDRAAHLDGWETQLQDTRLSDAPYVTVIARIPAFNLERIAQLKTAFANLPGMRVMVWQRVGVELQLDAVDSAALEEAARSMPTREGCEPS